MQISHAMHDSLLLVESGMPKPETEAGTKKPRLPYELVKMIRSVVADNPQGVYIVNFDQTFKVLLRDMGVLDFV